MALRGSLDSFGLPDVLRLIDSTGKSGALHVIADSLLGTVWVEDSKVIASETSIGVPAGEHAAALFQLLCLVDGEFEFTDGEEPDERQATVTLTDLIGEAEEQLIEWEDIQSVIPGLDAQVRLAAQLSVSEVLLDAEQWKLIVAVGTGAAVSSLGEELSIAQVPLGRQLKGLVEIGILEVMVSETEEASEEFEPETIAVLSEPILEEADQEPESDELAASIELEDDITESDIAIATVTSTDELEVDNQDTATVDEGQDAVDRLKARIEAVKGVTDSDVDLDAATSIASMTDDTVEFENEEANLSEEALPDGLFPADGDPNTDDINRGTLLKFLSSVRS